MPPSCYTPINTEKQEFRIVTIEPAPDHDQPIKCTLSVACLSAVPEFAAVSYVWGDASIANQISLDDKEFYVTTNLFHLLRRLRRPDAAFVCWIDAVCINQQDIPERNSQVLLRGELYKSAQYVIIWLGEEYGDSDLACSLLEKYGTATMAEVGPNVLDKASWEALRALFKRPWWTRVWVVQEFAKARDRVFICGSHVFDSITLISALAV
ncbi:Heterokaryon incompatibility protein (HET) domain containing protein [Hyaloscypha variabilis]